MAMNVRKTEAIQVSEEKYRELVENANSIILRRDPTGTITFFNEYASRFLGFSRDEIIGRNVVGTIVPSIDSAGKDLAQMILNIGAHPEQYKNNENENMCKDGTRVWVAWTNKPILNDQGRCVEILCIGNDITKRKQIEEELMVSRNRLSKAEIISRCGNWEFDLESKRVLSSDGARRIYGMLDRVWTIPEVQEIPLPEYRDMLDAALQGLVNKNLPYNVEFKIRRPDTGEIVDIHSVAEYDGHRNVVFGVIQDITNRKQAEKAQRESEDKYRTLIETTDTGFVIIDKDGLVLDANLEYVRLTGHHDLSEIVGRSVLEWTADSEKSQNTAAIKTALEKGYIRNLEIDYVDSRGNITPVEINATTMEIKGKTQIITICRNITERKRADEENQKLQDQLAQAQKMEFVGRLAGGVAHDFNNMLSVILGHTELALLQVDLEQPLHDNLEEIHKAAEHSAELTRQLLAFARKQTIAPRVLNLNETVDGMLKMLRRLIGEDIDLTWIPGGDLWQIKIDPAQIDQILANLLVNARDAIAGVGKVTIETENVEFDEAYCAMHAGFIPGEYVKLSVSDTGCGMEQEILAHIFEPFFTTKETGKGTGLGMATVYGIVKQNNGFINVYSEPGKGTTFKICLPRYAGKTARTSAEGPTEVAKGGPETVLLVEDEPSILKLGKTMLEGLGYRVLTAGTPGEAIRLAEKHAGEIHLLMTDVVMPEMNGRDLAKRLLSLYPSLKRLFMSGYTANVIAHHGILDEGVYFIQKPFSIKDLAAKVSEALDQK